MGALGGGRPVIIKGVTSRSRFTLDEARAAGERIGVDWGSAPFDVEQFRMGMDVELEHGTRDPQTNVTHDDATMTAKIAQNRVLAENLIRPGRSSYRATALVTLLFTALVTVTST